MADPTTGAPTTELDISPLQSGPSQSQTMGPAAVMRLISCLQHLASASGVEAAERKRELINFRPDSQELAGDAKRDLESSLKAALDYGIRRYGIVDRGYWIFERIARFGRHYGYIFFPILGRSDG
jgi:hypothetical protein